MHFEKSFTAGLSLTFCPHGKQRFFRPIERIQFSACEHDWKGLVEREGNFHQVLVVLELIRGFSFSDQINAGILLPIISRQK